MSDAQAAARHQQHVEELCAAALRALAGETDLHFRGRRLHRGRHRLPLYAPHLHPSLETDDFASFRGAADGLALRLARSNATQHRSYLEQQVEPLDAIARNLFDMFEQFRVESQAGDAWPGVQRNLRHRFERWLIAFHRSGLTDSARGLLVFTVAQICRSRITGEPPLEETEDLMEATRAGIAPAIGHALAGMRRSREDQAAFAPHALMLARWVAHRLREAGAEDTDAANDSEDERAIDERLVFGLRMDIEADDDGDHGNDAAVVGGTRDVDATGDYRIFTTAYDREVRAASLVREEQLEAYRAQLDRRAAGQGLNIPRLARELNALLAAPLRDAWADAQEEGLIDGRRLAQLVASPTERRLFRQELREPVADAVVAFLIDCSGSMRAHIESVAALVDAFARALDLAGM
ncbi:MAG: cobalt chelatase, partial [Proteobacteria bacterium]|nr:cobalt chelatase [Pseudomonadota bacterium]